MAAVLDFVGNIFGSISVEQPAFSTVPNEKLKSLGWEIRKYPPAVAVQTIPSSTEASQKQQDNDMFRRLAKYIGVFGSPENSVESTGSQQVDMTAPVITASQPVAMTAPVLTQPIAMTAPVLTNSNNSPEQKQQRSMAFILPSSFTIETAPRPTNPLVTLRQIPARTVASHRFSGSYSHDDAEKVLESKRAALEQNGYRVLDWELARYNPPWTLPFLRTNDLLVTVEQATDTSS